MECDLTIIFWINESSNFSQDTKTVVTFPIMFLSGSLFPQSQMPQFLQAIAQVLPLTYLNEGLRASIIFVQSQQAILNTPLITVLGLLFFRVGSWITKWEED